VRFAFLLLTICAFSALAEAKQEKKYYYVLGDTAWLMKSKAACDARLRSDQAYEAQLKKNKVYFESKWKSSCLNHLPPRF
jgi:hypothetical protein